MTVINEKFTINTQGFTDIIDITQKVKHAVCGCACICRRQYCFYNKY